MTGYTTITTTTTTTITITTTHYEISINMYNSTVK